MTNSFKYEVKIYYEDTDAGGVVYYANYLKFLERARSEAIYSLGLSNKEILAASDAFFPFIDGIEKLVQSGVQAVIQPSGSIRDKQIIKFANETDTVLLFSKTRHFRH